MDHDPEHDGHGTEHGEEGSPPAGSARALGRRGGLGLSGGRIRDGVGSRLLRRRFTPRAETHLRIGRGEVVAAAAAEVPLVAENVALGAGALRHGDHIIEVGKPVV